MDLVVHTARAHWRIAGHHLHRYASVWSGGRGSSGCFLNRPATLLRETFDNLFRTAPGKGDDARADKLTPADMTIKALDPTGVEAGATGVTVKVQGANFAQGAVVLVNDAARLTSGALPNLSPI